MIYPPVNLFCFVLFLNDLSIGLKGSEGKTDIFHRLIQFLNIITRAGPCQSQELGPPPDSHMDGKNLSLHPLPSQMHSYKAGSKGKNSNPSIPI